MNFRVEFCKSWKRYWKKNDEEKNGEIYDVIK